MAELDYQQIANHAEDIFMALLEQRGILKSKTPSGTEAVGIVPDVNVQLHKEFPDCTGTFRVRMAAARTDLGHPWWHFVFELLLPDGTRQGSAWDLTYEAPTRLGPVEQAALEERHRLN